MKLKVFVPEAGIIPRYYGVAYRDFMRMGAVCYPVPLNRLVRMLRSVYFWLRIPHGDYWEARDGGILASYMNRTDKQWEKKFNDAVDMEVVRRFDSLIMGIDKSWRDARKP